MRGLAARGFSTLWKKVFHRVEKFLKVFPLCGKTNVNGQTKEWLAGVGCAILPNMNNHRLAVRMRPNGRRERGCPAVRRWGVALLLALLPWSSLAARPWPDTSLRIVPFSDQLPNSLNATQRWFAATHFAGCQKMLRSEIQALRTYNTNFLCLHYQLAVGAGSANFIIGDTWGSDWSYVNAQSNWFFRNASTQRVHQTQWNWDLMDVRYTNGTPVSGFPAYWISNCLVRIRAAEDDGVFADSYTPDAYGFGQSSPTHPWLEDVDLCRTNWVPALEQFGRAARLALASNDFVFLPNLGGLVTGWLDMDYGVGHGGMIEGFAFWGPGDYFDPADWALQMDRALTLARSNKIVICQAYPGEGSAQERMFATTSYLLVKGSKTYLNLLVTSDVALEYYPEYEINLGGARGALPLGITALWNAAWGVYRRDYTNGIVLVNPSASAVNIPNLGATWWRAVTSGGGVVNSSGSYGGTLTAVAATNLSLPAHSGAVLFSTNPFAPPAGGPAQPASFRAIHRSGQTFLTWSERADLTNESYRVYRHTQPITTTNLAAATCLYQVWEGSADFPANRYADAAFQARYFDRVVITNGGTPLAAGTGLLVWTLATNDFTGGATGTAYYAVTTVNSGGTENRTNFTAGNAAGPLGEGVAEPLPVETAQNVGTRGHLYLQFMDLRKWNPTFHAPNPGNGYYGLDPDSPAVQHALAYAYDYVVFAPDCGTSAVPVTVSLHGWGGNSYGPVTEDPDPWGWCTYRIYPVDQGETWWFGFARDHDFRAGGEVAAGDVIVNYTEQRVLRMIRDLQRQPPGPPVDTNRLYVYGQSMGGSGTLALALRYPNVFAAAFASQPMTDYSTSGDGGGIDWRGDAEAKWGARALNLPVQLDAPAGWAAPIQSRSGTGVWTWQNHRLNATNRIGDDNVPFGITHGTNDDVIEWATQGRPVYGALDAGRRCWGGLVSAADHTWIGFEGLPPGLAPVDYAPFANFQVVRNETVPGLSRDSGDLASPPAQTGGYHLNLDWSASWNTWDGVPQDTATNWQMSLRAMDARTHTVDVTPRRTQRFHPASGATMAWRNLRVSDNVQIQSGTATVDASGLVTASNVTVSTTGNRVRFESGGGGSVFTPRRINCGGLAITGASPWLADTGYSGGTAKSTTTAIANATNAPLAVYQTRRYAPTLTYSFPDVPDGTYTIRLHFAEVYANAAGQRRFNVSIEGLTRLTNFDIYQQAGGKNRAVVRTFESVAVSGGLQIQGVASVDGAQFNGIEIEAAGPPPPAIVASPLQVTVAEEFTATFGVHLAAAPASAVTVTVARASGDADLTVSAGTSLIFTPANYATDQTVTLAAANDADSTAGTAVFQCTASGYTAASVTATEADNDVPAFSLKVNCGGPALTGGWSADTGYSGGTAKSTTTAIANATNAPQAVYQTRRYAPTLTYSFPAIPDGTYTIRLHFAEVYCSAAGQRRFNVTIEGLTRLTNFDIYQEAGGRNRAVVRTFENVAVSGGLQIQGVASVDGAQFNGIEIQTAGSGRRTAARVNSMKVAILHPPAIVRSSEDARAPGAGWAAVDGDLNTTWQAGGNRGSWLCLGYAEPIQVRAVDVQFAAGSPLGLYTLASDDADDWFELEPELELGPVELNYLWFIFPADLRMPPAAVREIQVQSGPTP